MAVYNLCLNVQRDPETGCAYDCGERHDYEQCRQSYFLKQQNQILKNKQSITVSPSTSSDTTTEAKIENLQEQIKTIQSRPADVTVSQYPTYLFAVIGFLIIVIAAMAFYIFKLKR